MASRIKKLFIKNKSTTEGKSLTKLETLLTGTLRLSSQSISRKERKKSECIQERRDSDNENNANRRRIQKRFLQKRYPSELCSPCNPPEMGFCLEQKVPLLSETTSDALETSTAPLCQATLTRSLDQSSCESISDSFRYFEEIALGESDMSPESIDIQSDDQQDAENDPCETYDPQTGLKLQSSQQSEKLESSDNLMQVLSHHQIEWAAMMEFQKVDSAGVFHGLSSREIRWILRESRRSTWLVETLGPLLEERSEVLDLNSVGSVESFDTC